MALAYQPAGALDEALRPDLTHFTKRPPPQRAALETALRRVREQGSELSDRQRDEGVLGLAVPVFDGPDHLAAVLGVRFTEPPDDALLPDVLAAALATARQATSDLRYEPSLFP